MIERDPTEQSRWRPLRLLQEAMDADIARIYAEAHIMSLRTAWVMELLRLHARGPMTIAELARSVHRTHSAMSQKVAAMRDAGWVRTTAGPDARSKRVALTPKAEQVVGRLAAEWRATEATVAEIEEEIPYPLSRVVTDIEAALRRKSFHDRIAGKLAQDPSWSGLLSSGGPAAARQPGRTGTRSASGAGAAALPKPRVLGAGTGRVAGHRVLPRRPGAARPGGVHGRRSPVHHGAGHRP
jgi:DNA-binding MarR family transcriptional regulator